jgi:hypothetical protein
MSNQDENTSNLEEYLRNAGRADPNAEVWPLLQPHESLFIQNLVRSTNELTQWVLDKTTKRGKPGPKPTEEREKVTEMVRQGASFADIWEWWMESHKVTRPRRDAAQVVKDAYHQQQERIRSLYKRVKNSSG